jgi:hypothetical protein
MSYFKDGKQFPYKQWKEIQELSKRIVKLGASPDEDVSAILEAKQLGMKIDAEWEITQIIMQKTKPRNNDEAQLTFEFEY